MRAEHEDYTGVKALANELGAEYTIDPTITPDMDGDRSILSLGLGAPRSATKCFGIRALVGDVEEFCAPPPAVDERRSGRVAVQRRPHRLLHFALWRCFSLRAVSAAQRQRAAAEVHRYLAILRRR